MKGVYGGNKFVCKIDFGIPRVAAATPSLSIVQSFPDHGSVGVFRTSGSG